MHRNISKIKIQNFQSHEYTIIELDKGVNVIVGKTDSGKSAIIRALRWLFFNEPRGTDFIRTGTDEVIVELLYDDGYIVRRIRNKKVNGYEVEFNSNLETYYGIGSEVPEEIIKITGVRKIKFSESNEAVMINFQNQHDGAFMLNDSPAQKSKSIGYISNVNVIDEAIRRANQHELNAKQEKKKYEIELENNINELKKYDNLDYEIKKLDLIKNKFDILKDKIEYKNKILILMNNLTEIENSISVGNSYIRKFIYIDKCVGLLKNLNIKYYDCTNLKDLLLRKTNNLLQLLDCKSDINRLQNVGKFKSVLDEIFNLYNKFQFSNKLFDDFVLSNDKINITKNILNDTNDLAILKEKLMSIKLFINKYDYLKSLYINYSESKQYLKSVNNIILEYDVQSIIEKYNILNDLKIKIEQYKSILYNFKSIEKDYFDFKYEYDTLNSEINKNVKIYLSYIEKSGICPLCGSIIDENHIKKIKKEYGYEL